MSRWIVLVVAIVLLAASLVPNAAASPQDDAGSGCDAGATAATAVPVSPGTHSGTLAGDPNAFPAPDPDDAYLVTVPAGAHVLRVSATSPEYLQLEVRNPSGGFVAWGDSEYYDLKALVTTPGSWFVGVGFYGLFNEGSAGCDVAGPIVPYEITIALEPRDNLLVLDRGTSDIHTLDLTLPEGSGTIVDVREDWRGDASWEASASLVELPGGSMCGQTDAYSRAPPAATALSAGGRTLLGPSTGGFAHGTFWTFDETDIRHVRFASAVSGTIHRTLTLAWNGDPGALSLAFPAATLGNRGPHDFASGATATVGGRVLIASGVLEFDIVGASSVVSLDPGSPDAALSAPVTLTRPGGAPEPLDAPATFSGAGSPAGVWRIDAPRFVGDRGPTARILSLPWEMPAGLSPCYV